MLLIHALRLGSLPEKISEEQVDALRAGAVLFLRAGGRLSLADWALLADCERAAFAAAGDVLAAEDVARRLVAEGRLEEAACALAPVDGGQADADLRAGAAADLAATRSLRRRQA